jgi:hypothetical protein
MSTATIGGCFRQRVTNLAGTSLPMSGIGQADSAAVRPPSTKSGLPARELLFPEAGIGCKTRVMT